VRIFEGLVPLTREAFTLRRSILSTLSTKCGWYVNYLFPTAYGSTRRREGAEAASSCTLTPELCVFA